MAEVIQPMQQGVNNVPNGGVVSQAGDMINGIFTNGFVVFIIIFVILIIALGIFIFLKLQKEDELKEQDDRLYAQFKSHLRATIHNKMLSWIKKSYSLKNIFLLGIPIFWNEHSLKVVDANHNLIGYYRGEVKTHKGETIYALYKKKDWIFFEHIFLLRCIYTFNYIHKTPIIDEKTKKETGKFNEENKEVNFEEFYKLLPKETDFRNKRELQIQCFGIEEDGYYYVPSYVTKDEKGLLNVADFRPEFRMNMKDYATDEQFKRLLRDSGQSVDGAVRTNPRVVAQKHWVEKTEEEVLRDKETPNQKGF